MDVEEGEDMDVDENSNEREDENYAPRSASLPPPSPPPPSMLPFAGPPFDSLAHMVAVLTFRYRSKIGVRVRSRSKGSSKGGKGLKKMSSSAKLQGVSVTTKRRVRLLQTFLQQKGKGGDEEVESDDDGYVRSSLALSSFTTTDLENERAEAERREKELEMEFMDIDACYSGDSLREPSLRSTYASPSPVNSAEAEESESEIPCEAAVACTCSASVVSGEEVAFSAVGIVAIGFEFVDSFGDSEIEEVTFSTELIEDLFIGEEVSFPTHVP
ncbi:hypothetical protein EST38_g7182 [Candolleomyces aberdarensis]|uniref:Uncharacterized protein n=1 Tax=Candolleomyces aberdarensis TaxID=2316362 RepID=A0A4Q2DHS7_9AGAR|nr:hypothetical protein EST38_g7182 [Candolleomyces aberdarensis]